MRRRNKFAPRLDKYPARDERFELVPRARVLRSWRDRGPNRTETLDRRALRAPGALEPIRGRIRSARYAAAAVRPGCREPTCSFPREISSPFVLARPLDERRTKRGRVPRAAFSPTGALLSSFHLSLSLSFCFPLFFPLSSPSRLTLAAALQLSTTHAPPPPPPLSPFVPPPSGTPSQPPSPPSSRFYAAIFLSLAGLRSPAARRFTCAHGSASNARLRSRARLRYSPIHLLRPPACLRFHAQVI